MWSLLIFSHASHISLGIEMSAYWLVYHLVQTIDCV